MKPIPRNQDIYLFSPINGLITQLVSDSILDKINTQSFNYGKDNDNPYITFQTGKKEEYKYIKIRLMPSNTFEIVKVRMLSAFYVETLDFIQNIEANHLNDALKTVLN